MTDQRPFSPESLGGGSEARGLRSGGEGGGLAWRVPLGSARGSGHDYLAALAALFFPPRLYWQRLPATAVISLPGA